MNKHATENYVNQNTITHLGEIESIQTVFNEDKFRYSGIYSYTLTSGNGTKNTQLAIINGTYEEPVQYFINLDNGLIAQRCWTNDEECWKDEVHGVDIWELPQFFGEGYALGNRPFTIELEEQIYNNTQTSDKVEPIMSYLVNSMCSVQCYSGTQTNENTIFFDFTPMLVIITSDNDEKRLPLILARGQNAEYMYEISSSGALIPHKIDVFFGPSEVYLISYDDNGYACMNSTGTYTCTAYCKYY